MAGDRAAVVGLRWTVMAVAIVQIIYVVGTIASDYTTGISTPYSMAALTIMLLTMVILAVVNVVWALLIPRRNTVGRCVLAICYLSVALFSLCVSSTYRDGVIALLWTIIISTTGILYGRTALTMGAIAMMVATLISPITTHYDQAHFVALLLIMGLTVYTSFLFYRYHEVGLIELRNYNQLKRRERLQTRRLRAVVNNLKDALVSISPTGDIQLYNSAALNLLDTNNDIMGVNADGLFHLLDENGDPIKLSTVVRAAKTTTERTDLQLVYEDGQKINLRLSIIPIKNQFTVRSDHDLDGVILMASDITKEKSLDDERDEFIGVVSHELRTPVAIAEGALSNLQLLIKRGGDPHVFADTLDAAHKQVLYLGQMVNDLATLSRAQRGLYMDTEAIDIDDFMSSLYQKYVGEAEARHLKLVADIGVTGKVLVPNMVIEEIMQNLITNALKYTEHGSVTIGVRPLESDKKHAEFYVRDTGIGIAKSDMEHIFQRFWRSEDYRTRKTSGTGLGLHVVEQLATKVGAKVHVQSELNQGSTFSIVLPIVPSR